ncbi:unnamed protein product [Effrenium voratum]|uniref:Fibronectin type-III domain-containing protein n=1 Tax=Effrenium voratum TaxID=2562239 RepID=A0AA36MWX3_9DINO|nr:unnamed protein product [Effrenium voratum]CAJ1425316.1 unnamed protein product [Effrenium voratum]
MGWKWLVAFLAGAFAQPTEVPGQVAFYDLDLDVGEISGTLEFVKASSEANIDAYNVYWGSSSSAKLLPFFTLAADGFAPSYAIPSNTAVPSTATHFLVFSSNSFGEGATPSSYAFTDRHVPTYGPNGIFFSDTGYTSGQVTGSITISRAASEADVTHYALYWGSSASTFLLYIATVPKATDPLVHGLAAATVPSGGTHLLAYTMNADGLNEAQIASALVYDRGVPAYPATSLAFLDLDLVQGEIGGLVSIGRAVDETAITSYAVYFAVAEEGPPGPSLGSVTASGQDVFVLVPTDTAPQVGYPYLIVRSRNADGEMATGIGILLVDRFVPVDPAQSISFLDEDLSLGVIGGTIEIGAALLETEISKYGIYWADASQQPISLIAELAPGDYNYSVALGTAKPSQAQYLLVLTGNEHGYMSSGASTALVDRAYPVNLPSQIQFDDADMDAGQIGGSLTVMRASDETDVTSYTAYYGSSAASDSSAQVALIGEILVASLPSGSTSAVFTIPMNTAPPGASYFLGFSKNSLGESLSGISASLVDKTNFFPTVAVSSVAFVDADLSSGLVGGSVTWLAPADTAGLTQYTVVFALDAAGTGRHPICSVAIGTHSCVVPLSTSLSAGGGSFAYVIVFTNNGFGEGPGLAAGLTDRALPVAVASGLSFPDTDVAVGSVGGTVTWTPPGNPSGATQFTHYQIYLAGSSSAANVLLGQVAVGTNSLVLADGQVLGNFSQVAVYTWNSAGEASAGTYAPVTDRFLPPEGVLNLFFWDQDFTVGEIGGDLAWLEPADTSSITHYGVKISCAESTSSLGQVAVGTDRFQVGFDTALANCTELLVVALNELGESPVVVSTTIEDRSTENCPNDTHHSFRSSHWRLVAHDGVTSAWKLQGLRFYEDALCSALLATVPSEWPRRPRLLPGAPVALPGATRNLHEIFQVSTRQGATVNGTEIVPSSRPWWSSGTPCAPFEPTNGSSPGCTVGFRWESDVVMSRQGRARSSGIVRPVAQRVHCVELDQSSLPGEYATQVSLEWYDEARQMYRSLLRRPATGGQLVMSYQGVLASQCG